MATMVHVDLARYEARYAVLPVAEALAMVRRHTPVLPVERVRTVAADGRVLAEPIVSDQRMPPFPASTVDGYAVRSTDDVEWRAVVRDVLAGQADADPLAPGHAMRIMTGAPLPGGADAVAMFEDTDEDGGRVRLARATRVGDNVRAVGVDLEIGQPVLARGTTIGSAEIGLLATLGSAEIPARRRPRVAVLSTGDELVEPDHPSPPPGAIRDSNRYALLSAAREAGAEGISLGSVRDDESAQMEALEEAFRQADVVVTSGGVSVGSRDLIKPLLERLGTVHFGRIALKPGKPLTFATVGQKLAFGLPGNPVSALVTFEVFVRPTLRRMQGDAQPERPRVSVTVEHDLTKTRDRTEYQRAIVRWEGGVLVARSTGSQISSRLLSMVGANALLEIEPGQGKLPAGSQVSALLIGPLAA